MIKILLILTAVTTLIFLIRIGYSADFTVEKVSNTVGKITTTKNVVNEESITITQLKQRKENLIANKTQAKTQYEATLAMIDTEITKVDSQLIEFEKAGIIEP